LQSPGMEEESVESGDRLNSRTSYDRRNIPLNKCIFAAGAVAVSD